MQFRVRPEVNYATEIEVFCVLYGITAPASYQDRFVGKVKVVDIGDEFINNLLTERPELYSSFMDMVMGFL